ncbi:PucR family transcriptional regulator ligand-binding domain-containing protein [Paenibacillus barcinonensis]|uniref:PucR family transcriptional regulator ligand-binding domain-containing protein n=2 Tax=Paenibacillus barcinonensis TaxID=198119 RepID=A0A2V4W6U3_PAEBA|nr:PucR family transcriptional regulator [Paenibacillus barcinonensis]PYE50728.1 purine catabolism regulator [Paenibacillus barcinonensis]QKS57412.1 PucR family transcriptional regulator ligand-binding domain-containing protein [Paenibacillus barcinonensis]
MEEPTLHIQIRDMLKRPVFRKAEYVASDCALERYVRWVHIMEVPEIGDLLSGGELILTTGIGWSEGNQRGLSFLHQLIACGAAGLCIELGEHTRPQLEGLKQIAAEADFPLIWFHDQVRYIDITQDLHFALIRSHQRRVAELDQLTTSFHQLLLNGDGVQPLLRLLSRNTGYAVALYPLEGEAAAVPYVPSEQLEIRRQQWFKQRVYTENNIQHNGESVARTITVQSGVSDTLHPHNKMSVISMPVQALEYTFADLVLFPPQPKDMDLKHPVQTHTSEAYVIQALERCAAAIAQDWMRMKYMEEKRRYKEDMWVIDWLNGIHSTKDIQEYLAAADPRFCKGQAVVILFDSHPAHNDSLRLQKILIQRNIVARSIFAREGFALYSTVLNLQIILIVIDPQSATLRKHKLWHCIQQLRQHEQEQTHQLFSSLLGIGQSCSDLSRLRESLESAKETLRIQKDIGAMQQPFYSNLHCYRIISSMKHSGNLNDFITEYLGPLIRYDSEKGGQLLLTLKQYLTLCCSKQETASALFIVRQTLYHRLDKIEALLGTDYLLPEKRVAMELALYAYEYMHGPLL